MEKVRAQTFIEVICDCPHCKAELDILDNLNVRKALKDKLRVENCDIKIVCDECDKSFIVSDIDF